MSFMPSMWNEERIGRAPSVLVVLSDSFVELVGFCLSKTLRCGKHMRAQNEMSWLDL
jgi:hypothetical protein